MAKKGIKLTVEEAKYRDAGRGMARLHSTALEKLGLVSGDIIEVKGKSTTCAIVWPAYPQDPEKHIRVDGELRGNAGVGIGDDVTIRKIEAKPAKKVTFAPTEVIRIVQGSQYLSRILEGRPVHQGQNIRVEMLGSPITFSVTSTKPDGMVLITKETEVILKEKPLEVTGTHVTYEDIGGLGKEIGLVREMIELPLRHPEIFQAIGIDPPKGVLLHGPPGTGKTLLAKAIANECDANFYSIRGPEIIAKYYGESEQRLREVFDEAEKNAPAILFIDEIDSLAPKRSEMSGEKQVEKRVVSTLLALMDGLQTRGKVIVIAATNQPNALDEALRRGGRFDREIEIGIPDKKGRLEILEIHTRGMPLSEDVKLKALAARTHGFVGADISSLCKEAGMHALRKLIPKIKEGKAVPAELLSTIKITGNDFEEALKFVEPSAMREVIIEIPDISWEDIGGLDQAKQELQETVEWPLKYPELYEYAKHKPSKGILLHGLPGTGKTLLAKAVAHESGINFISIKGPELISKYVGESEKRLRNIFRKAKQASPCILFFDEIDAVAPRRGSHSGDSGTSERFLSQFLTEMDGVEELKDVLVLAATNRLDMLDEALLRPGRFDRLVHIPMPDEKTRKEIFRIHTKGKPMADDLNLAKWAKKTDGQSGADIQAVCLAASELAIREFVDGKKDADVKKSCRKFKIRNKHFDKAYEALKTRGSKEQRKAKAVEKK